MQDGHLLVAIAHPFKYSGNNCLIAKQGDAEEIVNLVAWERLVDFYNTDINNTQQGIFVFCKSEPIFNPEMEWRCDNTMYGPRVFDSINPRPVTGNNALISFETFLSVHKVGYFVYIHMHNDTDIREEYKNNSVVPVSGFTLSELFKVVYEWSQISKEPFNSKEDVAIKASEFLNAIGFTVELIDNQTDMQVANYLKGSEQARLRPVDVVPNKPQLIEFVKKRMASSSMASLCVLYPGLFNFQEVLELEISELKAGIERFREYYGIPENWEMTETERIIEHCEVYIHDTVGPYVHNQLRLFKNKSLILEQLSKGYETEV